jgi:uncharacterized protein (TIGR03085 family)
MTSFARTERAALADALLAAGPDAPTLCAGWTTRDLAAHLVLRERRPDGSPGILLKRFAAHTRRIQDGLAAGDYTELVGKVRTPPLFLRPIFAEEAMNFVEFFVHHEDVRRGAPGWAPRRLSPEYERKLLSRTKGGTKLSARRFPATIVVSAPGLEPFTAGAGGERLEVSGAPGELLMFFVGRQQATNVEVSGPAALADKLRGARMGL